jgi:ubiquinone/menaquinone biosynthesis C-methylase UbiE
MWRALLNDAIRYPLEAGFIATRTAISEALQGCAGPVIDVGCGTGLFREAAGDRPWTGLDRDAHALSVAKRRIRRGDALVEGDAVHLPFGDGAFAAAVCHGVLHHAHDVEARAILAEIARVTRDRVVIADLISDGAGLPTRFFYALDRGTRVRGAAALRGLVSSVLRIERERMFRAGVNRKVVLVASLANR